MDSMVALRCKYCGAPLEEDAVKADSPYITCTSCGTTQQKIDAEAYLNQLMGQVRSWINQAMPGGMTMANAQNSSVDSVARHNIFMTNFKPRVEMEFTSYKFGMNNLFSQVMLVMPFTVNPGIKATHTSTQAFEFSAKMNGITPLAVTDETQGTLNEAIKVADAYAMLINNCELIREDKPGRYILMANNFTVAANDFGALRDYEPAKIRFESLALICGGCDKLLNGDTASAFGMFEQGKTLLKDAAAKTISNMKVAIMGQAINQEIKQAEALSELASYVNNLGRGQEVFEAVRKIFTFNYPATGNWAFLLNNHDRLGEIFSFMSTALNSKSGGGTVPITSGSGDILVPFWNIELAYSFQTGALWKKHAVEVREPLLIPADFVVDGGCLNNPRNAVTDVFTVKDSSGVFAGLTGNEKSISNSLGLGALIESAAENSVGGRQIIVPLSTRKEAERIAEYYVQAVSRVENKLKLSNPEVKGLIYIPFSKDGNGLSPRPEFGSILPARMKSVNLDQLIIL